MLNSMNKVLPCVSEEPGTQRFVCWKQQVSFELAHELNSARCGWMGWGLRAGILWRYSPTSQKLIGASSKGALRLLTLLPDCAAPAAAAAAAKAGRRS